MRPLTLQSDSGRSVIFSRQLLQHPYCYFFVTTACTKRYKIVRKLRYRKSIYISELTIEISSEFFTKWSLVKSSKTQMAGFQPSKGLKREIFPLFPSKDPPTALWSAFENRMMNKRYMQGECAVIELTCVNESERQFGFVHTTP